LKFVQFSLVRDIPKWKPSPTLPDLPGLWSEVLFVFAEVLFVIVLRPVLARDLHICRMSFSCCGSVLQRRIAAPAWAPRSKTCGDVDKGAPTPEVTPRLYAAGEVGALASKTCAWRSRRIND
jgi:hypothetical protein